MREEIQLTRLKSYAFGDFYVLLKLFMNRRNVMISNVFPCVHFMIS